MDTLQKVSSFISSKGLLGHGPRSLLLAVSGGPDSVALLDMFVRLTNARRTGHSARIKSPHSHKTENGEIDSLKTAGPLKLIVAHLDHLLRGQSSKDDALFVASLARKYALDFHLREIDVRKEAERQGRGIEEVARDARYHFFRELAEQTGADRVATGHTMTDQAETVIMRLIRGAGARGLAAMRPITPIPLSQTEDESQSTKDPNDESEAQRKTSPGNLPDSIEPLLIRPLLCITRQEVEEYCRSRKLEFRVDASNISLDYTRNRIRHCIFPELRVINPRIDESIARTADLLATDDEALDRIAELVLNTAVGSESEMRRFSSGHAFPINAFKSQFSAIAQRMIIQAAKLAKPSVQISSDHVAAVKALIEEGRSGKRIVLPGGVAVWKDGEYVVFQSDDCSGYEIPLETGLVSINPPGFEISVERGLSADLRDSLFAQVTAHNSRHSKNWLCAVLDDEKLPAQLVIRSRLAGESSTVLGHQGPKKLKKLMIDHRIPVSRRKLWPIVASADGRYIWSPELPPAKEFCADDESRTLAVLRAFPSETAGDSLVDYVMRSQNG